MVSPTTWVVSAAASRNMLAASMTLNAAQPAVPPVSFATVSTKRGVAALKRSAAFSRIMRRSVGPFADQAGNAAAAASAAATASAAVAAAARVATSPLMGLRRSNVARARGYLTTGDAKGGLHENSSKMGISPPRPLGHKAKLAVQSRSVAFIMPGPGTHERYTVGPSGDLPDGGRLVVDVGALTIGIFRVGGRLFAYENTCP